jgi:hypothetical protein
MAVEVVRLWGLGCFFWIAGSGAVRRVGVAGLVVPVVF